MRVSYPARRWLWVAAILWLFPAISGAASDAPTAPPAHSRYVVLGYLWADGKLTEGTWHFRSRTVEVADHFAAAAAAIGAHVTRRDVEQRGILFKTVQITGGPAEVPLAMAPFDPEKASPDELKAFLAAVIEGEGTAAGMVLDDPDRRHIDAMARLLARLGVKTRVEANADTTFFRLFAEKESWPIIQSFPFVAWKRVPGGKPAEPSAGPRP